MSLEVLLEPPITRKPVPKLILSHSQCRRFVATAAHCVCLSPLQSDFVTCEGGKLKYDTEEVIRVFVGLNTQDIEMAIERYRRLHEKRVEEVWMNA